MGFMDGFERGLSGNYRYEIAGKAVVCSHCGGEEFDERSGQLLSLIHISEPTRP